MYNLIYKGFCVALATNTYNQEVNIYQFWHLLSREYQYDAKEVCLSSMEEIYVIIEFRL